MTTVWQSIEARGILEIPGLPGVRVESLSVFPDPRGSLHELCRAGEIRHELNPNSPDQPPQL